MTVNARTEEFQHVELLGKYALFTNGRIDRSTVPEGWYCNDFRGSDDDPGELCYIEESVAVNHAGSILMPEKLELPPSGRLDTRDEFGFLDEGEMTLREFCEVHGLPYPPAKEKSHLRPARPDEAGLFYAQPLGEDERLGTFGHLQMDFGRGGKEFWRIWWLSDVKEGNYPAFQTELKEVVETLRKNVLKDRFAMERFRRRHDGKISGGGTQGYGYIVETEHYRYCLRCCPSSGSSSADLICYALDVQRQNMAQEKLPVGRVTYVGGDVQEFTDAEAFLKCLREELAFSSTTGFRYKVLANDPAIRKAVDDTLERWAENAQLAGVSRAYNHVYPGSNTRPFEQNFSWYRERIAAVQEIMKRFHIFYGLEFVGPKHLTDSFRYPFLHDLQGVRPLADQVDPSVGILFDLFHWYTGGGTQEDILWVKAHPERIVAVHVNDAIAGRAREAQLDNERAMPMTNGVIDVVGILRIFAVGGYDGPVLCEPMDPCYTEFETMHPEQVVLCLKEAYDRLWNNERKAGEYSGKRLEIFDSDQGYFLIRYRFRA